MLLLQILNIINAVIGALFIICYSYQIFYIIVACVKKPKKYPYTDKMGKYAFVISARDEERVIGQLCDSIRAQNYPEELIDILVVADNCTDKTAEVARDRGATVYERENIKEIGKGYALSFLFDCLKRDGLVDNYDGYFIVDADNLLDKDYTLEMNKAVMDGNRVIVCYRNSKNYGENWLSAGSGLWFHRASRHLNNPRTILGVSCEVNGTGFFVHREIIKKQGGWIHHLLIEDIEFAVDLVLHGEKVVYCHDAMVYDEQPTKFRQSIRQRKRWTVGYFQVLRKYGWRLIKGFFSGKGFSHFDMLMAISPAMVLTFTALVINLIALIISPIFGATVLLGTLVSVLMTAVGAYVFFLLVGLVSGISEWRKIGANTGRKLWSFFTFPAFMYTYLMVVSAALFYPKNEWKPIEHHAVDEESELIAKK